MLDTAALDSSLATLNLMLDFAIGSIVLGLILEYAPEFWSRPSRITSKWVTKLGEILVIAGVAGELALHIRSGQIEDAIKASQKKALAELHDRATKAELELAKLKQPRSLTLAQQQSIASKLRPFAGQQYALAVASGSEPAEFLCTLDRVLQTAGWVKGEPLGIIHISTPCGEVSANAISGVKFQVASSHEPQLRDRVVALVLAFEGTGVEAQAVQVPKSEIDQRPTAIQITVGIKPLPQ